MALPHPNSSFFEKWKYALFKATEYAMHLVGVPRSENQSKQFVRQCHRGYDHAQKLLFELLVETRLDSTIDKKEIVFRERLIRKIADAMAFSICGGSPAGLLPWSKGSPVHINFSEIYPLLQIVSRKNSQDTNAFHLLADLTTCLHVCDVMEINLNESVQQKLMPWEYKIGGDKLGDLVKLAYGDMRFCPMEFVSKSSKYDSEQMIRMLKQKLSAGSAISEFNRSLKSMESGLNSYPVYLERTYGEELNAAIRKARDEGRASFVADRCLVISVAFDKDSSQTGEVLLAELKQQQQQVEQACASTKNADVITGRWKIFDPFLTNLKTSICVPFTLWQLPLDDRADLVTKRLMVASALDVQMMLEYLRESGLDADLASKKQSGRFASSNCGRRPWMWEDRAISIDGKILSGEVFDPIATDLVRPSALIEFSKQL